LLPSAVGTDTESSASLPAVVTETDLTGFPVSQEELDGIEAYLMPQILEFLSGGEKQDQDSKVPQKTAMVTETSEPEP
jgi:hypothetical protein